MKKKFIALFAAVSALTVTLSVFAGCEDRNVFNGQTRYDAYADAESYKTGNFTYNAEEITSVEIDWVNQKISVRETSGDVFNVYETDAGLSDEEKMRYIMKDGKLTIKYWKSGHIGIPPVNAKRLTVEVPKSVELTVSAISAFIDVEGINTEDCKLQTVSGTITAKDCSVNRFNVNSVSGKIDLDVPNVDRLKVGVTSGNVCINAKTAKEIDVEATSGKVSVDTSASDDISVKTSSGSVYLQLNGQKLKSCKFDTTSGSSNVGKLVVGEGCLTVTVKTTSGSLKIKD